ncbi:uncharacterized protein LOC110250738 [Exaiptasia diaphana]|uniref:SAM domain-containing protein n=1 Tax=Exaiptasia diaphana TaxID=2652724 RepID=A0A913Y0X2_EXADI|nr:uncharacterized protein LOC110250738 [Exaiptasia diaphana]KXJ23339.1 hypothetical protein AC249_AIPGENE6177 [Exaiptasia diaphana]
MDGDGDIPALLKEYPLNYPCGKRRGKVLMYLAADVQEIKLKDTPQKSRLSQNALRRSPRLSKKMDVFLYAVGIDGKVSSSSEIIHNVSTTTTLKELTNLILEHSRDDTIYAPTKGIWWMRKGSKQLVSMKTEEDFHAGAQEYNETNVRIACVTIDAGPSSSVGSQSRKRKLDMSQGTTNPENDTWNTIHLTLIRDLESKGIKHRYSIKHLKLWTDLIVGGRLSGIGEEPNWTDHLEEVIVPPKSRRSSCTSPCSSIASSASSAASDGLQGGLLQMMMMNQQRSEMLHNTFMTTMLAMMQSKVTGMNPPNSSFTCNDSGNTSMPSRPATAKPQKMDLRNFNQEECCNFLLSLGLGKYIPQFQENQMDGQLLSALVHPHFGKMMLESMTLDEEERDTLISAIKAALV